MEYLVLGANGYIGSYLYKRMKQSGMKVIGTGRRITEKRFVHFDARKDSISSITQWMPGKEKAAILCIAQTNIDRCKTEEKKSRQINVEAVKRMTEELVREHYHVIYFSTDHVFDGRKGNYTEEDTTNAINEYGKMKEEMEYFLTKEYPEVCIFRLPKVLGAERNEKNMLMDWERRRLDDEIRCIRNMKMTVVSKEDIYQACLIAARQKMQGIYHLSSGEMYSRKEFATMFYERLGIGSKSIIELDVEEFGFQDRRPLNIGLDNSKFRNETGYCFRPYAAMIEEYLKNNGWDKKKR